MELINQTVPVNFNLFLFGDTHLYNTHTTLKGIQKCLSMIQSEYHGCKANYSIHMGDVADFILIGDKRHRPEEYEDSHPLRELASKFPDGVKQIEGAADILKPIKHTLITVLKGNHEDKLWAFTNTTTEICKLLGVPYGSFSCRVSFNDKRGNLLFKGFFEHGRKSISSTADDPRRREEQMRLILKRHLKDLAGDCVLMAKGDTHKLFIVDPTPRLYLRDSGVDIQDAYTEAELTDRYIHPDDRWYVNTGSFLRLHVVGKEGYAERAELPPVELGFAVMRFRDRKIEGIDKVRVTE